VIIALPPLTPVTVPR